MQTVAASVILDDAYRMIGWDADQLDTRNKKDARSAFSAALEDMWEAWWWEQLMVCQQVRMAENVPAVTTYNLLTGLYYTTPFTPPAVYTGTITGFVVGQQYTYSAGNSVALVPSGNPFALVSPGVFTATATSYGIVGPTDPSPTGPYPNVAITAEITVASIAASAGTYYWPQTDRYFQTAGTQPLASPTDSDGNLQAGWLTWQEFNYGSLWLAPTNNGYSLDARVRYSGTLYGSGIAANTDTPGATVNWIAVPDWHPSVPWFDSNNAMQGPAGPVRMVSRLDPRETANPGSFHTEVTPDGTRIVGLTVSHPWVWARRPTPIITGDDFDATATYDATAAQDLVFDS